MPQGLSHEAIAWIAKIAITLWMIAVAVLDHRHGRIPNRLTGPVFLGVGAYRVGWEGLWQGDYARLWLLAAWAVVYGLWMLNFIGGGDGKFLMAQLALFPSMEYVAVLAIVLLILTVPLLLWTMRGRSPGAMLPRSMGALADRRGVADAGRAASARQALCVDVRRAGNRLHVGVLVMAPARPCVRTGVR